MSNVARQNLVTSQAIPAGQAAAAAAVTEDATTVIPNEQTLLSLISIMHAAGDVEFKTTGGTKRMRDIASQAAKEELRYMGTAMSILTNETPAEWELQLRRVYGTDLAGAARLAMVIKKHLDTSVMNIHLGRAASLAARNQSHATRVIAGVSQETTGAFANPTSEETGTVGFGPSRTEEQGSRG